MANTITVVTDGGRVTGGKFNTVGLIQFSIATTETYATPTGITVDFATPLASFSPAVNYKDVIGVIGWLTTGHLGVWTKTGTAATFTVRFWNGATEISDGALNHTIKCFLLLSPSGVN